MYVAFYVFSVRREGIESFHPCLPLKEDFRKHALNALDSAGILLMVSLQL